MKWIISVLMGVTISIQAPERGSNRGSRRRTGGPKSLMETEGSDPITGIKPLKQLVRL